MTVQTQDQGIQKCARGAKTTLQVTFAAVAVLMAGTAIYAAATGMALSSTFLAYLANPWAIAIVASVAAVYLIAAAYQQWHSIEGTPGKDGRDGKDADFPACNAIIKSGTIYVGESGELFLKLSINDYKALAGEDEKAVHVLLAGKEVKLEHVSPAKDATEYKVKVSSIGEKDQLAEMKSELGMTEKDTSLTVRVSNQSYENVSQTAFGGLVDIMVEKAAQKAKVAA